MIQQKVQQELLCTCDHEQALDGIWTRDLYLTKVTLYQAELPRQYSSQSIGEPYNNHYEIGNLPSVASQNPAFVFSVDGGRKV